MKKLLVILGPTATGKTDLALSLAKKFSSKGRSASGWNGELVSCDSRQVYKGLDIGTGKISNFKSQISNFSKHRNYWKVNGVKVWMYDVVSPKKQYTVFDYVKDADRVIRRIRERGRLPVVVGGTGLYLKALLEGLSNFAIPVDVKLRNKLSKLSKEKLQEKLKKISIGRWNKMNTSDRQNPRRLIRAIELSLLSLRAQRSNLAKIKFQSRLPRPLYRTAQGPRNDVLGIGLTAPRDILYKRVDESVVTRINQGMIDEAKALHKNGLSLKRMRQLGLEYGVLSDYLSGKIREIEGKHGLIKIMQNKIHGYIRRQLTWFKREKNVFWVNITAKDYPQNVEKLVAQWYDQADVTEN